MNPINYSGSGSGTFVVVLSLLVRLLLAIVGVLRLKIFRSGVPQWIITLTYADVHLN